MTKQYIGSISASRARRNFERVIVDPPAIQHSDHLRLRVELETGNPFETSTISLVNKYVTPLHVRHSRHFDAPAPNASLGHPSAVRTDG